MNWLFEVFCKVSIFVNHRFNKSYKTILASHVAHLVKNPCAMQETWVQSLGWEDPLEKGTATHSSIPGWRIPCGRKELDMTEQLSLSLSFMAKICNRKCTHVQSSIIHNRENVEATQVSINRWMDKQNVICLYNEILLSLKKWVKFWFTLQHGWTLKTLY